MDEPTISFRLQWGRDLKIAEMAVTNLYLLRGTKLQWGRDLKIAEMPGGGPGRR